MAGSDPKNGGKSCPSARGTPGATLLGVLGSDGRIHNLRTPMAVDADFIADASRQGPPEARMRFASKCQTSGCSQWTGSRCGVIDKVMAHLQTVDMPAEDALPPCTIRATCRWFAQSGAEACGACSYVVTDQSAHAAE